MTKEQSEEIQRQVREILDQVKKQNDETATVVALCKKDVEALGKVDEGRKDAIAELTKQGKELQGRLFDLEQETKKAAQPARRLSLGEEVVNAKGLKEACEDMRGEMVKSKYRFQTKTITSLPASAGDGIFSDRQPGVIENPLRPLTIRNLIDVGTTDSNLIEWVQELVYTNNANVVTEGGLKPESNITYDLKSTPVRTIAHWIRASKQVLADFKQLQSLINGRLMLGLKIKEEDEILMGDGTGQHLLGLIPQATAYNTAFNVGGDSMIDTIRHAILQVRLAFYPASGVVMSPTDWHNLELTKDNENRYLLASPTSRTPPMIWGLPVVESDPIPRGNFLVGAFRLAATLWDREQAAILVSTEDQDNFVRNLVTILAEERLALTVHRPAAFVFGAFPAGSTT